jgi:hypothetical protein
MAINHDAEETDEKHLLRQSNERDETFRCILLCNDAIIINGDLQCNS